MAYVPIILILGALVRWAIRGFQGKLTDVLNEKSERKNFLIGITLIIILVLAMVPLVGVVLSNN
jgi:uncharacterized Tic20 family protein